MGASAVAQHDHAVGLGGKVGVVGDDDEGLAEFVTQIKEELVKALLIRRVKAPRWFVGEDDRRRIDEGASYGDTLALTTRQLGRLVRGTLRKAETLEESEGTLTYLRAGLSCDEGGEHNVL